MKNEMEMIYVCNYCEGSFGDNIIDYKTDLYRNRVYICSSKGKSSICLLQDKIIDNSGHVEGKTINYCPMCGKRLC